ncbi:MAG TPA: DUF177 domain-containing protein [Bdellovibrionota bacterium]|nr:DUF177 domain-containing protein [Bdellovibrionota bacterium]
MLIYVRNIPPDGLDVDFKMSSSIMTSRMAVHDELKETFRKDVDCHLRLEVSKKDVYVSGSAETSIHPTCARCDEPFDQPLFTDLSMTCSPAPDSTKAADSYQESEEGLVFYRNDQLDLSEIVREQVLLSLPMRYLCKEDCLGLCSRCGWNLNLGDHACAVRVTKH